MYKSRLDKRYEQLLHQRVNARRVIQQTSNCWAGDNERYLDMQKNAQHFLRATESEFDELKALTGRRLDNRPVKVLRRFR